MSKTKNLNDLNDILFSTLNDLKEGKIDNERARTVASVGSVIVSNAKTLLDASKFLDRPDVFLSSGVTGQKKLETPESELLPVKESGSLYEQKLRYAKSLGHPNIGAAIAASSSVEFNRSFKEWMQKT